MKILRAVQEVNASRPSHFFHQIQNYFKNLKGKSFAFWGLSFKKNTDDIKNSPALILAKKTSGSGGGTSYL